MTAKRMAEGGPRPQPTPQSQSLNNTFPTSTPQSRPYPTSSDPQRQRDLHPINQQGRVANGNGSSHFLSQSAPVKPPINPAPVDNGLSVQELKALTRMRLARESGSGSITSQSTNAPTQHHLNGGGSRSGFSNPSLPVTPPLERTPEKKCLEDYMGAALKTRSSSTSPTVESSSTGSDSDYVMQSYHAKKFTSPRSSRGISSSFISSHVAGSSPPDYHDGIESNGSHRSRSHSGGSVEKGSLLENLSMLPNSEHSRYQREHYHHEHGRDHSRDHSREHSRDRSREHSRDRSREHSHEHLHNDSVPSGGRQDYYHHDYHPGNQNGHIRSRSSRDYIPQDFAREGRSILDLERLDYERERLNARNESGFEGGRNEYIDHTRGIHHGLHAKLLTLEQQQLERELRDREQREQFQQPHLQKQRELQREQQLRDQRRREHLLQSQQNREQQHREQQLLEQHHREQKLRDQRMRDQHQREQHLREQQLREQQLREKQAIDHQQREQQLRENQQREQELKDQQLKKLYQPAAETSRNHLSVQIPESFDDDSISSVQSHPDQFKVDEDERQQQRHQQPVSDEHSTSNKQHVAPHHESSLRRMVLTKSMSGNISSYDIPVSSSGTVDNSLLPSGSPFRPAVSSGAESPLFAALPDLQPSPPDSPRSLRNGNRKPLSVTCPAPVRLRSSSDINDLAFSVAESVLLTPTAMSPANTFHKGPLSPSSKSSSRRNSIDSPRGSLSLATPSGNDSLSNSIGHCCSGSLASGGGNSSVLDVDMLMMNQLSLDSNDEYTHSTVEMANSITDL